MTFFLNMGEAKITYFIGNQNIKDFLGGKPNLLKRILGQAQAPLKDAAAVNSTGWKLDNELKSTGLGKLVRT